MSPAECVGRSSAMKKINLRTLLIIVILISSLSVIFQNITMQTSLIILSILLIILRNPSKKSFLKTMHRLKRIGKVIVTLMLFQILFRHNGKELFSFWIIKITSGGLEYGITSSLRFFLIILIAGLLFEIPYYDYLLAFKAWKIPYEISFLVATVIYFIPLFANEFKKSVEALHLRGIQLGKIPLKNRLRAYTDLVFPVIAKAISDVQYRTISLELRGFRLNKNRTSIYKNKLSSTDLVIQIVTIGIFIGVLIMNL